MTNIWIKVSHKLPEPGQTVLTWPHYKVLPFGNYSDDLEGDWSDSDFWELDQNANTIEVKPYPIYWMPLPEAPEDFKEYSFLNIVNN